LTIENLSLQKDLDKLIELRQDIKAEEYKCRKQQANVKTKRNRSLPEAIS